MRAAEKFARLALALAAMLGLGGTAMAQDELPHVISPLTVASDQNGVNLIDGKLEIGMPVLEIPAAPHLRFDRIQNAAPYMSGVLGSNGASTYSVHTGTGTSDSFRCTDADCISVTGSGSTFHTVTHKYRQSGSGAQWTYNIVYGVTAASGHTSMIYYAAGVAYPNGENITYSYDSATLTGDTLGRTFRRPNRIESNLGYAITITYQGSDLNADPTAWGTPAQVTLIPTASGSTAIAWLTYSGDSITLHGTGETNGGRTYHCAGCNALMGTELEVWAGSLQLPTEGAASTSVTAVSGSQVVGSVTRDGVAYNYAYDNLRSQLPWSLDLLYDHLTVSGPNSFHNVYTYAQPWVSTHSRRMVLTGITDSIGRTTSYSYDEYFRPLSMTLPGGNQAAVGYDDFGNLIWHMATPAGGGTALTESAHYMTDTCTPTAASVICYRADWSRDAMGRQTDYSYNSLGQLTEQLDPADANGIRRRTTIVYALSTNGISRRTAVRICADTGASCTASAPIQTAYDYSGRGDSTLPAAVAQIDGTGALSPLVTSYTYDPAGRVTMVDGPLTGTDDATYTRYDVYGRKTWEIGGLSASGLRLATRTTYRDSDDKASYTESGTIPDASSTNLTVLSRTDLTYDGRRYAVRAAVSSGGALQSVTDQTYDDQGRLMCSAIRMNPASWSTMPGACALTTTNPALGPDRITMNSYDAAGQLLQEIRAYQVTTANGYPQTLQQNYATYTYSSNGKQTSVTDANGNRAEMTYDGFDRQIRWNFPSPTTAGTVSATDYEAYTYDAIGNRTSLRKRDGSMLTYSYDNLNRMLVKVVPERSGLAATHTRDVYYGYDLRNAQLYARFDSAAGDGVTNAYDGFGRQTSSTLNMDGASRTISSLYREDGARTRVTHPDSQAFTYAYSPAAELTGVYQGTGTGTPLDTFTYNAQALLSGRMESAGSSVAYTYDVPGRLASLTDAFVGGTGNVALTFGYNAASQITQRIRSNDAYASNASYAVNRSYSVNGLNQYTAAGSASFTYDANGNLTSDGSNTYVYDVENRLVTASGGHTATLRYDPLGRLYEVVGTLTTRFLYDGDALVAEYNGAGTLTDRYVHGSNSAADDPLIWYGGGVTHWLHADQQGSILAMTNGLGALSSINAYDEWGIPNVTNAGRFQYTGQAWLAELGMYYYKARIYSPTLGRFMQTDPVGYEDQINLYEYVGDDPVNRADPSGEQTDWIGAILDIEGIISPGVAIGRDIGDAIQHPSVWTIAVAAIDVVPDGEAVAGGLREGRVALRELRAYESGAVSDLRARSRVGDGLDVHHAPQAHVAEQGHPGYSRAHGPAIALPAAEHRAMPAIKGRASLTTRSMLAQEARNLRNFTNATNTHIRSWLALAKRYFGVR